MKKVFLLSLIAIGTALSTTSCVKKCKLTKETTDSGVIIKDAMVISEGGYQIYNMPAGDYHINASNPYSETYEISFDAGLTKQSVNYSQYSILANPCIVKCDAAFERNVTIDDVNQIVNYTIKVTECSTTCDAEYLVENYVLVPAFPDNYTLVLDVQKTQQ